jgi:CheY-like chemotaxis protein
LGSPTTCWPTRRKTAINALETIERNARAQAQLIDDLLDISRIITGKLRLDVRQIDPGSIIGLVIEALRPSADDKEIRIEKAIDTSEITINGDPARLQQVVWNLLANAIKFTSRGGRVQIRLKRINSYIEIIVSDTGVGIKPEFIPHVFERFRQADQNTTRQHGGLGLGLSIVRHFVELHGGTVRAESEGEAQGSTFTVRLPVASLNQVGPSGAHAYPSARNLLTSNESTKRLDTLKVLVVDDEPDTREMLNAGLSHYGAEVIVAGSVVEALEIMSTLVPDLIISDIGMPDMDGYEFIRQVRAMPAERGGKIPAIALTAYTRVEDRMQVLSDGYQKHVPKPVDLIELVTVAATLIQG